MILVRGHHHRGDGHIFALGDVNGGPQFTYISLDDARIVIDQLLGRGSGQLPTGRRFRTPSSSRAAGDRRVDRDPGTRPGADIKMSRENVATSSRCPGRTRSRRPGG